jgi:hypothetical protein
VEADDLRRIDFSAIGWREGDDCRTGVIIPEAEGGRGNMGSYGFMGMAFDLGETSDWPRDKLELGGGEKITWSKAGPLGT